MRELHSNVKAVKDYTSMRELQRLHGNQHHRAMPNHIHEGGMGRGVGMRPEGWSTGEDVILKSELMSLKPLGQ
jgi:hypothetical protein